jgi:hypothetical protein
MLDLKNTVGFTPEAPLPVARLARLDLVAVDCYSLLDAEGDSPAASLVRAHIETLLPGGRDLWIRVGFISEDQSGWDEHEGKWEYHYRDDVVFARRQDLEAAIREWNKSEGPLSWRLFQDLAR